MLASQLGIRLILLIGKTVPPWRCWFGRRVWVGLGPSGRGLCLFRTYLVGRLSRCGAVLQLVQAGGQHRDGGRPVGVSAFIPKDLTQLVGAQ